MPDISNNAIFKYYGGLFIENVYIKRCVGICLILPIKKVDQTSYIII